MTKSHRQKRKPYAKLANANAIAKSVNAIADAIADVMSQLLRKKKSNLFS